MKRKGDAGDGVARVPESEREGRRDELVCRDPDARSNKRPRKPWNVSVGPNDPEPEDPLSERSPSEAFEKREIEDADTRHGEREGSKVVRRLEPPPLRPSLHPGQDASAELRHAEKKRIEHARTESPCERRGPRRRRAKRRKLASECRVIGEPRGRFLLQASLNHP